MVVLFFEMSLFRKKTNKSRLFVLFVLSRTLTSIFTVAHAENDFTAVRIRDKIARFLWKSHVFVFFVAIPDFFFFVFDKNGPENIEYWSRRTSLIQGQS